MIQDAIVQEQSERISPRGSHEQYFWLQDGLTAPTGQATIADTTGQVGETFDLEEVTRFDRALELVK